MQTLQSDFSFEQLNTRLLEHAAQSLGQKPEDMVAPGPRFVEFMAWELSRLYQSMKQREEYSHTPGTLGDPRYMGIYPGLF